MTSPTPSAEMKMKPCPFCDASLIPMTVDGEPFKHQGLFAMQHIAASECFLACQRVVGKREYERWNRRPTSTRRERQACLKCGTVTLDGKCHCSEVGGEPQFVNYADHLAAECNRLAQSPSRREVLEEAARKLEEIDADLLAIRDRYIDSQSSGRFDNRRIHADAARRYAHDFAERADATRQCARIVRSLASEGE